MNQLLIHSTYAVQQGNLSHMWSNTSSLESLVSVGKNTGSSKKMDGIWNRYNLKKSTGRIYTFGVLKCSEKFKVLDLP